MKKEIIKAEYGLNLVKFSLTSRERLRRLGGLIPDLLFPRFWDGEKYVYDSLSERWETFVDDLKAGISGYWLGYQ